MLWWWKWNGLKIFNVEGKGRKKEEKRLSCGSWDFFLVVVVMVDGGMEVEEQVKPLKGKVVGFLGC